VAGWAIEILYDSHREETEATSPKHAFLNIRLSNFTVADEAICVYLALGTFVNVSYIFTVSGKAKINSY
jgi:hypothetical protein